MRDNFDDIIKRKLEQLPIEGTPDWPALQDKIEGEAFDTLLRNQLSSTTNQSGADKVLPAIVGWDSLEHKLDLENEVEGDVFDRILSQKLANLETTVQPEASWKILSHRMDTLWPLRKVLARYRVLEIAAAIALLLTFAPHLRDNPISVGVGSSPTASASQELSQRSSLLAVNTLGDFLDPEEIEAKVYAAEGSTTLLLNSTVSSDYLPLSEPSELVSSSVDPVFSPFALVKRMFGWLNSSNGLKAKAALANTSTEEHFRQGLSTRINTKHTSTFVNQLATSPKGDLKLTSLDLAGLSTLPETNGLSPVIPNPVSTPKSSKWELGTHAGLQVWNISTPLDVEFAQQAFSRWQGSTSVGISANYKLGERTALGLGVSHSRLAYDPDLPTVFNAADISSGFPFNRTESFEGITVNLAQVPIDFRVQLTKPGKRASILAFVGIAGNFSLSSDYDVERTIGAPPVSTGPPSELEEIIVNENTFSDVKEFAPGIFESNGRFSGNTFLSARVGLESTIKVNNRISAFSAISYNHFLPTIGGFGPNNDQLSSFGFNVGARVNL